MHANSDAMVIKVKVDMDIDTYLGARGQDQSGRDTGADETLWDQYTLQYVLRP